jgi:hypothetical protein
VVPGDGKDVSVMGTSAGGVRDALFYGHSYGVDCGARVLFVDRLTREASEGAEPLMKAKERTMRSILRLGATRGRVRTFQLWEQAPVE